MIDYDAAVSDAQLAGTTAAGGVTSSAGPWPVTRAGVAGKHDLIGDQVVSGRPTPGDTVDRVTITAGRWWQAPGEIVLDQDTAARLGTGIGGSVPLYPQPASGGKGGRGRGARKGPALTPPGGGQGGTEPVPARTLTVVGIAASVSTPDVAAWMSPTDLAALTPGVAPARRCSIASIHRHGRGPFGSGRANHRDPPCRAVAGSTTYLEAKANVDSIAQLYVPILLAFSIFALLAAGFTIANVVSGIVLTSYRDIGVMKAVGFTPVQVTAILVGQILVPVTLGAVAGVIVGTIAVSRSSSRPPSRSGCRPPSRFRPRSSSLVLAVSVAVALLAAIVPAVHAGRLSAVDAIGRGSAPSRGRDGGRLRRLGLRLPVAVPARLGVAAGAAHPGRAAMTLGALLVGVAAVTFAIGMNASAPPRHGPARSEAGESGESGSR